MSNEQFLAKLEKHIEQRKQHVSAPTWDDFKDLAVMLLTADEAPADEQPAESTTETPA